MATVELHTPDGRVTPIHLPDGPQYVEIHIRECACGCGTWFDPTEPTQTYVSVLHRARVNNAKRDRKTGRRKAG